MQTGLYRVRAVLAARQELEPANANDSFCHFRKSSAALSMHCALFDKKTGVGVPKPLSADEASPACPEHLGACSEPLGERAQRTIEIPAPAGKNLSLQSLL